MARIILPDPPESEEIHFYKDSPIILHFYSDEDDDPSKDYGWRSHNSEENVYKISERINFSIARNVFFYHM
jgi:hypothetical protein